MVNLIFKLAKTYPRSPRTGLIANTPAKNSPSNSTTPDPPSTSKPFASKVDYQRYQARTSPCLNSMATPPMRALAAPTDVVPQTAGDSGEPPNEITPGEAKAIGPHPLQKHHFEEPRQNSGNGSGETQDQGPAT